MRKRLLKRNRPDTRCITIRHSVFEDEDEDDEEFYDEIQEEIEFQQREDAARREYEKITLRHAAEQVEATKYVVYWALFVAVVFLVSIVVFIGVNWCRHKAGYLGR